MAAVIGALRETVANETRVALVPEIAHRHRRSSAAWQ